MKVDEKSMYMYIGKRIILGLTTIGSDGAIIEQRQLVGIISQCSPTTGIVVASESGATEDLQLPYCLDALIAAPPGTYSLPSTGIEVTNPDLMSSWTFQEDKEGRWRAKPDSLEQPPTNRRQTGTDHDK